MSKSTTGHKRIADLEQRVRDMERRLNALMRQQEDAQRLVSSSPLAAHDAHVDRVIEDARRKLKDA